MRHRATRHVETRSLGIFEYCDAPCDCVGQGRAMQRLAMGEVSRACMESWPSLPGVASALANGLARLIDGGCIIRGHFEDAAGVPLTCAHARAESLAALRQTFQASPHALAFACSAQATRIGQPVLLPRVSSKVLQLWTLPPAWSYLEQHQIGSLLVAPVRSSRRVGATIVVWREQLCRPLTTAHSVLLHELGQRIGLAVRQTNRSSFSALYRSANRTMPDSERVAVLSIQQ